MLIGVLSVEVDLLQNNLHGLVVGPVTVRSLVENTVGVGLPEHGDMPGSNTLLLSQETEGGVVTKQIGTIYPVTTGLTHEQLDGTQDILTNDAVKNGFEGFVQSVDLGERIVDCQLEVGVTGGVRNGVVLHGYFTFFLAGLCSRRA